VLLQSATEFSHAVYKFIFLSAFNNVRVYSSLVSFLKTEIYV
jgi:hypothetical protein